MKVFMLKKERENTFEQTNQEGSEQSKRQKE